MATAVVASQSTACATSTQDTRHSCEAGGDEALVRFPRSGDVNVVRNLAIATSRRRLNYDEHSAACFNREDSLTA